MTINNSMIGLKHLVNMIATEVLEEDIKVQVEIADSIRACEREEEIRVYSQIAGLLRYYRDNIAKK